MCLSPKQRFFEEMIIFHGTSIITKPCKIAFEKKAQFSDTPHIENFIDACQGRGKPACEILEGHRSTTLAHLGNLACRLGRPLRYDGTTESVAGDPEANSLLGRKGRGSFVIPEKI
jgi:hypothetical protein